MLLNLLMAIPSLYLALIRPLLPARLKQCIQRHPKTDKLEDADRNVRQHWRPSLKAFSLPPRKSSDGCPNLREHLLTRQFSCRDVPTFNFRYRCLPPELRALVESFLSPADVNCLAQTCRKLREETYGVLSARELDGLQKYSLRRRLDKDGFQLLCMMEEEGYLADGMAVCASCLRIHEKGKFLEDDSRQVESCERRCTISHHIFQICGCYESSISELRAMLDVLAAIPGGTGVLHYAIKAPVAEMSISSQPNIPLVSLIEHGHTNNSTIGHPDRPFSRTCIFADDTGLVLQHNFHIGTHLGADNTQPASDWDTTSNLNICSHMTAKVAARMLNLVDNLYSKHLHLLLARCWEASCRTQFGIFEAEGEGEESGDGVGELSDGDDEAAKELFLRVERRFGWLDRVPREFSRVQEQLDREYDWQRPAKAQSKWFGRILRR